MNPEILQQMLAEQQAAKQQPQPGMGMQGMEQEVPRAASISDVDPAEVQAFLKSQGKPNTSITEWARNQVLQG